MVRSLVLALCLALPLGGCLESRDALTLKADGSGTIASSYVVDLQKWKDLAGMYAMMQQGLSYEEAQAIKIEDLPDPAAPAWFELAAKDVEGYEITRATQTVADGKRTTRVESRFTSLEAAARGGAFFASTVTLSKVEKTEKLPQGAWKLTIKTALSGGDAQAMGGMDPSQALAMVEEQVKDLNIGVSIALPTKILEHNGDKSEGAEKVAWTVTYDKILEGKDVTMSVTFACADDLKLKAFTYTPDMRALQRRVIRKAPKAKKPEAKKGAAEKGEAEKADAPKEAEAPKKADAPKKDEAPGEPAKDR